MHRRSAVLLAVVTACGGRATPPPAAPAASPVRAAAPVPAEPATLRYAADAGRYRIESAVRTVNEMMGAGDQPITTTMVLRTTLTDDAGQLLLTATVDSITLAGNAPGMDPGAVLSARGKVFRARYTPTGRPLPTPATADSADPLAIQLGRGVRDLLGTLPPSTSAGTTWSDTLNESSPLPTGGGNMTSRAIRHHRVVGWETRDGARALHIASSGTFTIAGTGEVQGQAIVLDGGGSATADRWVSSTGMFLGLTSNDSTNLVVSVTSVGMTIPVRQLQRTTVTRLP